MFVLSAGMQKSGSGYFYNIINDLICNSGGIDARDLKERKKLDSLMKWHNNNIGHINFTKLFYIWAISLQEGKFVVKTHDGPAFSTYLFNSMGLMKIIYSYRDPRDVLLSAFDHGRRIRAEGEYHTFAKLLDMEFSQALNLIKEWIYISEKFLAMTGILTIKYEEMVSDTAIVIRKIENFLNITINDETRNSIIWKYSKDNPSAIRTGLHLNKAKINRYKNEMTPNEIKLCNDTLGIHLINMGYSID